MLSGLDLSGGERNIVSLIPRLTEVGIEPVLCTLNRRRDGPLATEALERGVERHDLDMQRLPDWAGWQRYVALLRDLRPALVHAHDQDGILLASWGRFRTGTPLIVTRHVLDEPGDEFKAAARARATLFCLRRVADRVVGVSDATAEHLVRRHRLNPTKVTTVRNGLEALSQRPPSDEQREQVRQEHGWNNSFVVLMVSVLRPGKGHDVLLESIPQLVRRVPAVRVVMVGTGPLQADIARASHQYSSTIELLGQRTDVLSLMAASDALVLPSWSEALPTVLMEAGAVGLPVVATDVGGVSEIVDHGVTGFLVPPGDVATLVDRLAEVADDPERAARLGARAQERVRRDFSLDRQAAELADLYRHVAC